MSNQIKAIKIDPNKREVSEIEVDNSFEGKHGMYREMQCETIQQFPLEELKGDTALFDEEGLLKGNKVKRWTFKHGAYQDFAGIALIVSERGENYGDTTLTAKEIWEQIRFLD